jgi:hypothetical protein
MSSEQALRHNPDHVRPESRCFRLKVEKRIMFYFPVTRDGFLAMLEERGNLDGSFSEWKTSFGAFWPTLR